eukprot:gb/GFBE01010166.1/.p1 GENE.gb/GFBE01010166.1/~~gb/GFBE01010166.1/.p1  ORF type:complete len:501 (+),score=105.05 gb/GFBE01010166.1/:1-1503(+)
MACPQHQRISKLTTEFVGTGFLCLTVALTAKTDPLAPIAIGCVLMVLVYAGGHSSGAHYNPAVTLAIAVRGGGKMEPIDVILYMITQFAGAVVGMLLAWAKITKDLSGHPVLGYDVNYGSAYLAEFMVTLALCTVVLQTATTDAQANNSYYGLAIGFTVLSGAVAVGGTSGGAFNPAVGLMSAFYEDSQEDCWVYFVGPFAGAIIAGLWFRLCTPAEYQEEAPSPSRTTVGAAAMEILGTMILCFTVGTAGGNGSPLAGLAIGSTLMALVYAGGSISGAHYNPAVTIALLLRSFCGATHDGFSIQEAAIYIPSQILGAALGTFAAWGAWADNAKVGYPAVSLNKGYGDAFLGEILGTFLLVYVCLNVATIKQLAGNSYFGVAIGLVVAAMAPAVGPITGGAFNPAVGLMGAFTGGERYPIETIWVYWIACPIGAVLATLFFRIQNFEEFHTELEGQRFMAHASAAKPHKQKFMVHAHVNGARLRKEVAAEVAAEAKEVDI